MNQELKNTIMQYIQFIDATANNIEVRSESVVHLFNLRSKVKELGDYIINLEIQKEENKKEE